MAIQNVEHKKIFVGVSWPYASGNVHIGHLAGQYVACDIFARYHRLKGNKVLMVSGSDCHGAPVELAAETQGISPEQLAENSHKEILETYTKLNFLYDNYTSTRTENHKEVVQNIFLTLKEKGFLFKEKSMQYYDPEVKRFLPDRYVKGTCPKCEANNARGDECPECGEFLTPEDLKNPYSTLSDATPLLKKTTHYYLDLPKNAKDLESWVSKAGKNWRKWVVQSTKGMLKTGLQPRPVTRDLKYGISVPLENWEDKCIYVWFEAVIGYLSASIEWAQKRENLSEWEEFWKDSNCEHYYFIAGGNVPFHTVIWPSQLLAYSKKYEEEETFNKYLLPGETIKAPLNLPYDVPANKMLMYKGKKMSKEGEDKITLKYLLNTYNSDLIRYFCTKYAPENQDREFVWKDLIEANNAELVGNLGNFINRVLTFTSTKFDKSVPPGELDTEVEDQISTAFKNCGGYIEKRQFIKAIDTILDLGHFANKYFNDQEPWEDVKNNISNAQNTIYNSIQLVNAIRILLKPFTPETSEKLRVLLNIEQEYDPNYELKETGQVKNFANFWTFTNIEAEHNINEPQIIFQKLEYSENLRNEDEENVKEVSISQGKGVNLEIDEELKHIPIKWETFNNLKIQKRNQKVKEWIEEVIEKVKERYKHENWDKEELFEKYRELHQDFSQEEKTKPSAQNLIEIIKEKGTIPNINTLVDICNAVSALTGISIGIHDLSKINEKVYFKTLKEDSKYTPINKQKKEIAKSGEYVYADNEKIICRLDSKQSEETKVTKDTKDALIIVQGNEILDEDELQRALKLLEEGITLIQKKN